MIRSIITKEPDKRIKDIFQSNPNIEFTFLSIFQYQEISINKKWLDNLKHGYFNWIIFTSFRSWQILMNKIKRESDNIPEQTKIGVFGISCVEQIKRCSGRVDFSAHADSATDFGLNFLSQLSPKQKIAYPVSFNASTDLEKCLLTKNVLVFRENIYKPKCIIDAKIINEIMVNTMPDSMVFFSSKSVKVFMDNCSDEILNKIERMKLFALGKPTCNSLQKYSIRRIIKPKYPNIYMLSDLIYKVAEAEEKKNYVFAKTN